MVKFSAKLGLNGLCATILLSLGHLIRAVDYLVLDGRKSEGIELLLQDGNQEPTREAGRLVIDALWREMPFGFHGDILKHTLIDELLCYSEKLKDGFLGQNECARVSSLCLATCKFHIIQARDVSRNAPG